MKLKTLIKLWNKLEKIPVNEKDELEKNFQTPSITFVKGISKFSVWYWFDVRLEEIAPQYILNDLILHKIKG